MEREKRKRVAWGITGSGDKLAETLDVMKKVRTKYVAEVDIRVYLSKAGVQVLKHYRLVDELGKDFGNFKIEENSNSPFLAGAIQTRKFEFLLIAPATSNTVAKIAFGIADSLLSNAAIMALKSFVPIYVMPSDYKEGRVTTKVPDGQYLELTVRREDAENTRRLAAIENVSVIEKPDDIEKIFEKHFGCT